MTKYCEHGEFELSYLVGEAQILQPPEVCLLDASLYAQMNHPIPQFTHFSFLLTPLLVGKVGPSQQEIVNHSMHFKGCLLLP